MISYITKTIILTFIILVVIYIFIFRRIRKKKNEKFDTIQEYHDAYIKKNGIRRKTNSQNNINTSFTIYSGDSGSEGRTNNYITKYNSSEDYIER